MSKWLETPSRVPLFKERVPLPVLFALLLTFGTALGVPVGLIIAKSSGGPAPAEATHERGASARSRGGGSSPGGIAPDVESLDCSRDELVASSFVDYVKEPGGRETPGASARVAPEAPLGRFLDHELPGLPRENLIKEIESQDYARFVFIQEGRRLAVFHLSPSRATWRVDRYTACQSLLVDGLR